MLTTTTNHTPTLATVFCDFGGDLALQFKYNPQKTTVLLELTHINIMWQVHKRPITRQLVYKHFGKTYCGNDLNTILFWINDNYKEMINAINQ